MGRHQFDRCTTSSRVNGFCIVSELTVGTS